MRADWWLAVSEVSTSDSDVSWDDTPDFRKCSNNICSDCLHMFAKEFIMWNFLLHLLTFVWGWHWGLFISFYETALLPKHASPDLSPNIKALIISDVDICSLVTAVPSDVFFRKFSGLWPEIEIVVIACRLCPTFWRSCISEHKVSQENIQDSGTMSKMGLKSVCWIQCEVNIGTCFVHVFGLISTTILYVKKYLLYV